MKVVSSAAVVVAALALSASAATAAPAHRSSTDGGSFCGTAQSIAKYLKGALTLSSSGVVATTPANLKLAYTTVVKAGPTLLATAPKKLKPSVAGTLSFVDLVAKDFAKAGWQISKLKPYFPGLVAKATAEQHSITVVKTYLNGTCHVPV